MAHPIDTRRTLLFLRRGDEILLAMKKRGFGEGKINGVGGKLEPGETVEQATIRECQEEIGVTPKTLQKVAEIDFIQQSTSTDPFHIYAYVYITDTWDGEPVETDEMAPKWYPITDIPYDKMWDDDRYWLPLMLEGKTLTATFSFDEHEHVLSHEIIETDTPYVTT